MLYNAHRAYVAGVPYLVAIVEMGEIAVVPPAVGVRQQAYAFHIPKRFLM